MKLATFGPFVVSARAIRQGDSWKGMFAVGKYHGTGPLAMRVVDDTPSDLAYMTRDEAEDAAFLEGRALALVHARSARQ
jgi:hypothetical protein